MVEANSLSSRILRSVLKRPVRSSTVPEAAAADEVVAVASNTDADTEANSGAERHLLPDSMGGGGTAEETSDAIGLLDAAVADSKWPTPPAYEKAVVRTTLLPRSTSTVGSPPLLPRPLLSAVEAAGSMGAPGELDLLRLEKEQLQRKVQEQALVNTQLYRSLVNAGLYANEPLAFDWRAAFATTARTTTANLAELLRNQAIAGNIAAAAAASANNVDSYSGFNNRNFNNHNNNNNYANHINSYGNQVAYTTTTASMPFGGAGGQSALGSLVSMLPLGDMMGGLGTVFERLFGSKVWLYTIVFILISVGLIMLVCFCTYCCCCSSVGRYLMCCFRCGGCARSSSSAASCCANKKKKKMANDEDDKCCWRCCV